MEKSDNITKNILMLVKASGKSQSQIAREMGIVHSSLHQYITGRALPSLPMFRRLCRALDCTYEDILGEMQQCFK